MKYDEELEVIAVPCKVFETDGRYKLILLGLGQAYQLSVMLCEMAKVLRKTGYKGVVLIDTFLYSGFAPHRFQSMVFDGDDFIYETRTLVEDVKEEEVVEIYTYLAENIEKTKVLISHNKRFGEKDYAKKKEEILSIILKYDPNNRDSSVKLNKPKQKRLSPINRLMGLLGSGEEE